MLTLNTIRENSAEVISRLQVKHFDATRQVADILAMDEDINLLIILLIWFLF